MKFTKTYSKKLHLYLAKENLAPTLLAVEELPNGWKMVVMEMIKDATYWDAGSASQNLKNELKRALNLMETKKYVHGDLREPNILVKGDRGIYLFILFYLFLVLKKMRCFIYFFILFFYSSYF